MVYFVKYLTNKLHQALPDSKVIWYDSVTTDGQLIWQNELNDKNMPFYLNCDGIFLNYTWKEQNLVASLTNRDTACSNLPACPVPEVYVGIDVFGRGMIGDGGFNTKLAVEMVRRHRMSIAIFAPAWTYEKFKPGDRMKRDGEFWLALAPYLYAENCRFLGLPLCFNNLQRTFEIRERIATDQGIALASDETKVPADYLTNLMCQTTVPLLLPTPSWNEYYTIHSQGAVYYRHKPIDVANLSRDIIIPFYMTNIEIPPAMGKLGEILLSCHFLLPSVHFNPGSGDNDAVRRIYSMGIKYWMEPLNGSSVDSTEDHKLEVPFMPQLSLVGGDDGLLGRASDHLIMKIVQTTFRIEDKNCIATSKEILKICSVKVLMNISVNENFLGEQTNYDDTTYTLREIYLKVHDIPIELGTSNQLDSGGPAQRMDKLLCALTYFDMRFKGEEKLRLGSTQPTNEQLQYYNFYIHDYQLCRDGWKLVKLMMQLRWQSGYRLPSHNSYTITLEGYQPALLPDKEDTSDRVTPLVHISNPNGLQYYAIFDRVQYKWKRATDFKEQTVGAGEITLNNDGWRFVGLTTTPNYFLCRHIEMPPRSNVKLHSLQILLHPMQTAYFDLHERVMLVNSSIINVKF